MRFGLLPVKIIYGGDLDGIGFVLEEDWRGGVVGKLDEAVFNSSYLWRRPLR